MCGLSGFIGFARRQSGDVHALRGDASVGVDRLDPLIERVVLVAGGLTQRIGDAEQIALCIVSIGGLIALRIGLGDLVAYGA